MPLWLDILIAAAAVAGIFLVHFQVKNNKKVRIATQILLAVILTAALLYAAAAVLLLSAIDGPEPTSASMPTASAAPVQTTEPTTIPKEQQYRDIARNRVSDRIEQALIDLEDMPSEETSMVSFPFDPVRAEGRQTLDTVQQEMYDRLLEEKLKLKPFLYTVEEYDYSGLDNLLMADMALGIDHPLLDSYCSLEEVFEEDKTTAMRSHYFMPYDQDMKALTTEEEMTALQEELAIFEEECQLIVEAIPRDKSVYDQYRFLAIYLSLTACYDDLGIGGMMTSTPYGAIESGLAICQGYSKAFEYLCEKAGLWCKCVSGTSQGVAHMWNLIKLEDGTYHVDVTWSDDGVNLPGDPGWFQYFAVPQETILQYDHEITDGTVATGTRSILPRKLMQ